MDHAALMIRPSRKIAATIAAAVVRDNPLPGSEDMDFRNGRLFIHVLRTR
jgi:hypothetical protein